MSEFFLKIVNMSISASWLVLAVLLLRLVLKKAPKWVSVLLWGFVAVRLLCPFSIESVLSLIPSTQTVSPGIMMDRTPGISTGIAPLDQVVNPIISASFTPNPATSANPLQIWIPVWGNLWILGIAAMLIYTAVSYMLLRRKVVTAVLLRENIFQSENVDSPFVLGMICPKIYLPFQMDIQNLEHVIAHEQSHLRRKDHWWKPLGFLLLTIHWFNPLIWVGYVLLCRDIEIACDEKVIREMDNETKADYTQALVACSVNRRSIAACPLAFGEVGVKARVKSIMHYRKPALWVMIAALLLCAVVAVCFLTDPVPYIRNPWVREYIPGGDGIIGSVDKEEYESVSEDFAIGADRYGRAVFKDPHKAFDTLTILYAEGIALIQEQNDLAPITHKNYSAYKKLGWQTTSGPEEAQQQAKFVSKFLDIYENSFTKDTPAASTETATTEAFAGFTFDQTYGVVQVTYDHPGTSYSMVAQVNTPEYKVDENKHLFSVKEHAGETTWTDLGELVEITLTKDIFDGLFTSNSGDGWITGESASRIRRNTVRAWQVIYRQEFLYYVLQQKNGELYLAYGYYDFAEKDDPGSDDTHIRWLYLLARQTVMVPTDTEFSGFQAGILLLPIDGQTYRYDLTDQGPEGLTPEVLLYQFKEPDLHTSIDWEVYSLKEYPDKTVVLASSETNGQWLCSYSPPRSCADTALADAIQAGYVVMENGIATHGQELWGRFYDLTRQGKAADVTVAHYQEWENFSSDSAYYEAMIQDYPNLNVYQLSFDGEEYTLTFADGNVRTYAYLMKYETVSNSTLSSKELPVMNRYVLTHEEIATWDDLWKNMVSSAGIYHIEHYSIYTEKNNDPNAYIVK